MPRLLSALALTLALTLPARGGSSNSLLDVTPDGRRLVVASTDQGTVSVVDAKGRKKLCEVPVGDHPEGVSWVGNGPLALVTVWGDDKLVWVDADAGKVVHTLAVADEPYGVVVTKDGSRAYVSHDYPGIVAEIDVAARKVLRTFQAGACVRGLALSPDEKTLYATEFFTAKLIALDRASGKVTETWAGQASDNLCRNVVLHPDWPTAYLPHIRSRVTGFDARGSIFSTLSVCDLGTTKAGEPRRRMHSADTFNGVLVVSNAWEAAVTPDGKRLYTLYAGTDDLNLFDPVNDRYQDAEPTGGIRRVGKHPKAIRVSPDGTEVYVSNTLDFEVGVYDRDIRKKLGEVKVTAPPHTPEWVRGKELFVSARQPMGSVKWISCSSCHPDGLSDARVWQNPEGDRRTVHLWGLAHTHPLHWSADRDEVQDFEYTVRGKLMRGRGLFDGTLKPRPNFLTLAELDMDLSGKSKDLDALAIYTNSFESRLSPHAAGPGKLTPEAERGRTLFTSAAVGCASCHSGPYYTDSSLKRPYVTHDVGTGDSPREKMGGKYDTPTLIGVYRTGPYLHDGRAKTLRDVLTTANPDDKHGRTGHLTPAEVNDVVAFLKSLPFEPPPAETPNTVPYRLKPAAKGGG
ncbi:MAG: c-type cytochrome [Gemmataceae bacterium]|nr:c-type cytochrome [Gemmataceae bacterium]